MAACTAAGNDGIAALQCRSSQGDKLAQLELGQRFEEGIHVARSAKQAARLYRAAAAATSGTTYVYSPPVGGERSGRVLPVRLGPATPGLPEAQFRLARLYLEGRGVRRDRGRAVRLLKSASRAGSPAAAALLDALSGSERRSPRLDPSVADRD
jgi:TPR repeat protein